MPQLVTAAVPSLFCEKGCPTYLYIVGCSVMARQGAKRRVEHNAQRLFILQWAMIGASLAHVLVRFGITWRSVFWGDILGALLTSGLGLFCHFQLKTAAAPMYGPDGELVDGGADLSGGGLLGYYQDLLYIGILVQLGSLFTRQMWWIYLVVPLYGCYLLYTYALPFLSSAQTSTSQGPGEDSTAERKRREKRERKQQRPVYRR